ncbi:MAG: hypothetical protein VX286_00170, partial [Bacteroidota bacterium]|nr:hypothetical protein [Bacteroidota bacterium]
MKLPISFGIILLMSLGLANAQNYGCTYTFAPEYDPSADTNDGSCTYNVQQLLYDGYCIADLMSEGLPSYVFLGLNTINATDEALYNPTGRMKIAHIREEANEVYYIYETPSNSSGSYYNLPWGCMGTSIITPGANAWGGGASATIDIITHECSLNDNELSAAEYAYNFEAFGYDDWYLPSQA